MGKGIYERIKASDKRQDVQRDIAKGMTQEEIMEKHNVSAGYFGIQRRALYDKMRTKTELVKDTIVEEVWGDAGTLLKNLAIVKKKLVSEIADKATIDVEMSDLKKKKKKIDMITSIENTVYRSGGMYTPYELEMMASKIIEEEMGLMRLEMERQKNQSNAERENNLADLFSKFINGEEDEAEVILEDE